MANPRWRFAPGLFVRPALALIALAGSIALVLWAWPRFSKPPLERFRRAALALSARPTDGRLSGWPHLKARAVTRSAADSPSPPALLRLRGIAGDTLLTSHDPHARAVAHLVAGDTTAAIEEFRRASAQSNDADFWNDYAVACLTRSDELDDPTLAIDAVAACDHALAINGAHAAAHFNRGLALNRLGLLTSAADEWKRAAAEDPGSDWAAEALQRAHDVPPNTLDAWTHAVPHIGELDPNQLDALVRAYPQQARAYGEGIAMSDWADAILAGDAVKAEQRLTLARCIGDTLRALSGEMLLHDAVLAADEATGKGTSRTLATAYTIYRGGRIAHSKQDGVKAEAELHKAEPLFASFGSPMALVSRYYAASALFAQLRTADSEALLGVLDAPALEQHSYFALAAQIGWERGLSLLAGGDVSGAIVVFEHSRSLFGRIGEQQFSATMSSFVASSYDYVSAPADAWRERRHALAILSASRDVQRTAVTLTLAASHMARLREWCRADALYGLAIDAALRGGNPGTIAIAYSRRAMVKLQNGATAETEHDLDEARRWSRALTDPRMRAQAEANIDFAEGMVSMRDDPRRAANRFGEALLYYDRAGYRVEMPRIHLERARAERAIGRVADARRELAAGIALLESERGNVRDVDLRETLFAGADELFQEAIDLALDAGERDAAFAIAETERARALLDAFAFGGDPAHRTSSPLAPSEICRALTADSAIVEYCALPHRTVAFVVRHDGIDVVPLGSKERFAEATDRLRTGADGADLASASRAASAILFEPLRRSLGGIVRIAFIRTPQVAGVPFAALYDPLHERFLLESMALVEAPSATLVISASRRALPSPSAPTLAIGASHFDTVRYPYASPLPSAEREATSAAAAHHNSMLLLGDQATREAILRELPRYAIVHFAGHGIGAAGGREAALLVAPSEGAGAAEVRTSDLARLRFDQTRLVVLAACRSGAAQGYNHAADDVALALLAAGVPSIVASSGDLDDDFALRVMPAFHRLIAAGQTPAVALRGVLLSEIRASPGGVRQYHDWTSVHLIGGSADFIDPQTKGD